MELEVKLVETPSFDQIDFDNLEFGKLFTDHMISCDYENGSWGNLVIEPLKELRFHPATHVFHYGQAVFEGLKAYRTPDGINLFRVKDNIARLNKSLVRMAMPRLDENRVLSALKKWMDIERKWVPSRSQGSLYIRPFVISTSRTLRANPSDKYKFMLIASPVGFYYNHPISVRLERNFTRAAIGGVGYAKAAGNYAAAFMPSKKAKEAGFDQLLWTDPSSDHELEELGSANVFLVIDSKLYTPKLKDSILDGITRDTFLCLAREMGYEAIEATITSDQLVSYLKENRVQAIFATGTAAAVTYITRVEIEGTMYQVDSESADEVKKIKEYMDDLKYGQQKEDYGWSVIV